jgi:tellurite methyltransferase
MRRSHGFDANMNADEQTRWNQRYTDSPSSWIEPDGFLVSAYEEFLADTKPGTALDVAGGAGRNSVWLAERGWRVKLIDISDVALQLAREKFNVTRNNSSSQPGAASLQDKQVAAVHSSGTTALLAGDLQTEIVDLNSVDDLGNGQYDLVISFYFLRRELFPAIVRALKPEGTLIYRTYTIDRMKVPGGPSDPRYLLQPSELLHSFPGMRVLHYHEMLQGKAAAELVARRENSTLALKSI